MPKAKGASQHEPFRAAVTAAAHLCWKPGLQAVKRNEGRGQIDGSRLLGGACIDDDCRASHPRDNRWDYVIGCKRAGSPIAHFVEVHSAETCEVSTIEAKLDWLHRFLQQPQQQGLAAIPAEYHWVASGRINIPKHLPQYRRLQTTLRKRGLKGPVRHLTVA